MDELRGRAWRRSKSRCKSRKNSAQSEETSSSEKNWKLMYMRSDKLRRSRKLGTEYPKRTIRQILDNEQPLDE